METMHVEITEGIQQLSADPLPFARKPELNALEATIKQNTIVYLEGGSGETLIAAMLLRSYACQLKKPSPFFAVFLVPSKSLIQQQSKALTMHTDLKVGKYRGGKGKANQDAASWRKEVDEHEVLVMTPDILHGALSRGFLKIDLIKVLIFDECHHAKRKHPYARIMKEFYHQELNAKNSNLPRILGMTDSPIKAKGCGSESAQQIQKLENLMHSKTYICARECVPFSIPKLESYEDSDNPHHVFEALDDELKLLQIKVEYSSRETKVSEECKKLPQIGALTDNPVLNVVEEDKDAEIIDSSEEHIVELIKYVPPELVGCASKGSRTLYHCYLIVLEPEFDYHIKTQDIMLALRTRLEFDNEILNFDLDVDKGRLNVALRYHGVIELNPEEVLICQRFQLTVLSVLIDKNLNKLLGVPGKLYPCGERAVIDYLLLPTTGSRSDPLINWECVYSVLFPCESNKHVDHSPAKCNGRLLRTYRDPVCSCMMENCLVVTPHNGLLYCISGILDKLDGNSLLNSKNKGSNTYKAHFEKSHNISLKAVEQPLLSGKGVFSAPNYLQGCRNQKTKGLPNKNVQNVIFAESSKASVELPPELCFVVMSPIPVASFYSFSFAPSIMHRVESLLLAGNLKKILVDHCMQNDVIPTVKILEAITTKGCQENFSLELLETLGDSFLKYAVSQQLFKTYENDREGPLSKKREELVSNTSLYKRACDCKILGFIRSERFDPKTWIIPGDNTRACTLENELLLSRRMFYSSWRRKIKSKRVSDVPEALIGAFLVSGGELAAVSFMEWLGFKVDFICSPYTNPIQLSPEMLVNVNFFESLLNYKFQDTSLLVEALTHGSYKTAKVPRCFQRLEFLGDAVLDYLITMYLYREHHGLSPELITDLRSASANNGFYAQCAIKAGLHKHILNNSQKLQEHFDTSVQIYEKSSVSTFWWEFEIPFPEVLGDIIESLAGAIFIDSEYRKEIVFQSMRRLLEPMITPETLKLQPVRELNELCQKKHYHLEKPDVPSCKNGKATVTVEVEANGVTYKRSYSATNKGTAEKLACNAMLKLLKEMHV